MQQSGGLLLAAGWTAAKQLFSAEQKKQTNLRRVTPYFQMGIGFFCIRKGDSNDQMQQSGGLLLAAGWTAAKQLFSAEQKKQTNLRHYDGSTCGCCFCFS